MAINSRPSLLADRPNPNNEIPTSTASGVQLSVAPVNEFQHIIRLVNAPVTLTRTSAVIASGSLTLATFPNELDYILGATMRLTSITSDGSALTSANLVVSVGTVAADTANGTLTSTEADIIPSTAAAMTASAVGVVATRSSAVPGLFNGQSSAVNVRLNFATSDEITSTRTLTVNGYIIITATSLGNTNLNL